MQKIRTEEDRKACNRERSKKYYYNNLEKSRNRSREYQKKKRLEIRQKLDELEKIKTCSVS